jgi:hypothetical protein
MLIISGLKLFLEGVFGTLLRPLRSCLFVKILVSKRPFLRLSKISNSTLYPTSFQPPIIRTKSSGSRK